MNLPFGLQSKKEAARKEEAALLEQKLAEYRDTLAKYQKYIQEYSSILDSYEKYYRQDQQNSAKTEKDILSLKEQNNKTADLLDDLNRQFDNVSNQLYEMKTEIEGKTLTNLESLLSSMSDISYKLDALDKNVVNRLSELLLELQKQTLYQNKQHQTELLGSQERITKAMKKGHTLQWIMMIINIFGLGVLIFLVLYVLEIIPISF